MSDEAPAEDESEPTAAEVVGPAGEPKARDLVERGAAFPASAFAERWENLRVGSPPPPTWLREPPLNIQPERWAIRVEFREREIPYQLTQDLKELTPQAILRDLHRPVREFFVTPEPIEGTDPIGQFHVEIARIRDAHHLEPRPQIEPLAQLVADEQARRRGFLAEPWKPTKPDDAPRTTYVEEPVE